jgi:hypothetical protein
LALFFAESIELVGFAIGLENVSGRCRTGVGGMSAGAATNGPERADRWFAVFWAPASTNN